MRAAQQPNMLCTCATTISTRTNDFLQRDQRVCEVLHEQHGEEAAAATAQRKLPPCLHRHILVTIAQRGALDTLALAGLQRAALCVSSVRTADVM